MFILNKWLLAGLVVVAGEMISIAPSMAQSHDTSSGTTTHSPVHNGVPNTGINGLLDPDTGVLTVEGLGNGITLSPDIIKTFWEARGIDPSSVDGADTITVCLSDPCLSSGEGTSISLKDLAKLMEEDLQKSLKDLAEAETNKEPRRFARRRSTDCAISAVQLRNTVKTKLEASQKFVEQVEKISPDNNVW